MHTELVACHETPHEKKFKSMGAPYVSVAHHTCTQRARDHATSCFEIHTMHAHVHEGVGRKSHGWDEAVTNLMAGHVVCLCDHELLGQSARTARGLHVCCDLHQCILPLPDTYRTSCRPPLPPGIITPSYVNSTCSSASRHHDSHRN